MLPLRSDVRNETFITNIKITTLAPHRPLLTSLTTLVTSPPMSLRARIKRMTLRAERLGRETRVHLLTSLTNIKITLSALLGASTPDALVETKIAPKLHSVIVVGCGVAHHMSVAAVGELALGTVGVHELRHDRRDESSKSGRSLGHRNLRRLLRMIATTTTTDETTTVTKSLLNLETCVVTLRNPHSRRRLLLLLLLHRRRSRNLLLLLLNFRFLTEIMSEEFDSNFSVGLALLEKVPRSVRLSLG